MATQAQLQSLDRQEQSPRRSLLAKTKSNEQHQQIAEKAAEWMFGLIQNENNPNDSNPLSQQFLHQLGLSAGQRPFNSKLNKTTSVVSHVSNGLVRNDSVLSEGGLVRNLSSVSYISGGGMARTVSAMSEDMDVEMEDNESANQLTIANVVQSKKKAAELKRVISADSSNSNNDQELYDMLQLKKGADPKQLLMDKEAIEHDDVIIGENQEDSDDENMYDDEDNSGSASSSSKNSRNNESGTESTVAETNAPTPKNKDFNGDSMSVWRKPTSGKGSANPDKRPRGRPRKDPSQLAKRKRPTGKRVLKKIAQQEAAMRGNDVFILYRETIDPANLMDTTPETVGVYANLKSANDKLLDMLVVWPPIPEFQDKLKRGQAGKLAKDEDGGFEVWLNEDGRNFNGETLHYWVDKQMVQ